jgi:hypothetical protein
MRTALFVIALLATVILSTFIGVGSLDATPAPDDRVVVRPPSPPSDDGRRYL